MKKAILSITVFMLILLTFGGVAFARPQYVESLANAEGYSDSDFLEISFAAQAVATSSSVVMEFRNIAAFDALWLDLQSVSAGNSTTANVSWQNKNGLELATETITSGVGNAITTMAASRAKITYYNNNAAPTTVTGSIFISND